VFDSGNKDLIDGYSLTWIDSKWNQSIYKGEEQIPGYIFDVEYNDQFIIAKQHPLKNGFYSKPNYEITNFYIIDITKNKSGYKKGIFGPMSENDFNELSENLKIKKILKFKILK